MMPSWVSDVRAAGDVRVLMRGLAVVVLLNLQFLLLRVAAAAGMAGFEGKGQARFTDDVQRTAGHHAAVSADRLQFRG
jgi:hypothetical protein